ncbi:MAG: hypothetical protein ACYTE2_03095 [Planctomycetota bacterium]|jgi:hypothetical protein
MNDADRIRFLRRSPHPALLASAIATLLVASGLAAPPTAIDPPAAAGSFGLELVEDDGAVIATWIEPREGAAAIRFSRFDPAGKGSWSAPRTVAERKDLFANWADRPAVRRVADGSLLAHELRKIAEGTYAYGVRLSRSTDEGATWTDLGWLHDDTRSVEHGFVSMLTEGDDTLAVWLDGREMPEQAAGDGHGHGHGHEAAGGAMTLRTAILPGKGLAPKAESPKGPATSRGLDGRVCECCATDVAMTDRGPVVVYRDRGPNEERDISIVRRDQGRWTAPAPVSSDGWIMPGCPVNGPSIAADGSKVCVVWFTAAVGDLDDPSPPRTLAARSPDGGATFGPAVELSATTIGRTDVVMLPSGDAVACWVDRLDPPIAGESPMDRRTDRGSIALRRIRADGSLGETLLAAPMHPGRLAGVPRLASLGGDGTEPRLLLSWRDEDSDRLRAMVLRPPQ